ncbi:toll/interleukin-1 receptor domain-containing protein [Aeromonas veronii]|uniref:toll/interleukin-1 receptor domain-containing protein n=1 Tax=Aeromonas veronii TaxID=654 RepID=UPI003435700A
MGQGRIRHARDSGGGATFGSFGFKAKLVKAWFILDIHAFPSAVTPSNSRNRWETALKAAAQPDLRDVFLCHAWDDRQGVAKELHDLLEAAGVKVWFSEKDLSLGVPDDARHRQRAWQIHE